MGENTNLYSFYDKNMLVRTNDAKKNYESKSMRKYYAHSYEYYFQIHVTIASKRYK
jgi:hypothetical protein